jgi:hypothetical protein
MDSLEPVAADTERRTPHATSHDDPVDPRRYVATVIEGYVQLPHTPNRPRKNDRILAKQLFNQKTPLDIVRAAFILASSRRTFRPKNASPLEPIRSLAYFLPVVEELQRTPPDRLYIQLLKQRLDTSFPDLGVPPLEPPIPW